MPAKPYIIEEYVRWSDVDFAGIIFYGSYVRFFEIAETELFRACGLAYARVFDRYDIFLPRKAVHSEFYLPARLDDRLRVATYVGRVGTKSMTLNFDVLRDDPPRLGAAGWMVLVCVDRKGLKPQPLPPGLVEALAPHTLTTAAARAILGITTPPGVRGRKDCCCKGLLTGTVSSCGCAEAAADRRRPARGRCCSGVIRYRRAARRSACGT